jgi:DNA-binding FadR family transcriptional regulator
MMQNGPADVSRRSAQITLVASQTPISRATPALVTDVLHRSELWTLLECHAVRRVALSPTRDTRPVRAVFPELNQQVIAPSEPAAWQRLERRVHHAIAELAGNPVLGAMVAEVCGELERICAQHVPRPIHRPGTLWLLQSQHRKILSCIEAGLADEAVLHTRAHLHLIRDQLVLALSASRLG